ncbi:Maleylacetate reductase [Variovorax sp. WDL1]|nr:Maleylacetate reductase [Variovorax sp. B2]PNG47842.1 Maleylacetate reductase [Variovorax sp. B4]VTV15423.1 Maleylacetate reductase [Variovorax sp. WDL1]
MNPMLPASFTHRGTATRLVLREGAIDGLRAELAELGIARPLVLGGARMQRSTLFARVIAALEGLPHVLAEPVPAHSSVGLVEGLAAQSIANGVDGFIAVGGGSASDTAKAVALLMAEGGRLANHAVRFTPPASLVVPRLLAPKLPIVAIPQTASGAEVTVSLGVRDEDGAKLLFTDTQLAARLVLIDPRANLEMPAALMCTTGMNGLAHCIEGLYSKERSPLAETLALDAMARFAQALPAVHRAPGDAGARAALLYAAHLSGLVLVNARTCLHHAICHAIGAVTGAGHGDANAVMLPHAVAFNADAAAEPLARAAAALGGGASAGALVRALHELQSAIGVPARLRDIGVPPKDLDRIAAKTMRERGLYYNPRPVAGEREIRALLDAAY